MKKLILSSAMLMLIASTSAIAGQNHTLATQGKNLAQSSEYKNVETVCKHRWCGG
ncbi:hypothetical protein [Acinetobacter sp. A47]|uniref:hypothetical protein n=1 Tax=Acinetobacter sp. A47 TaxID=1561217 RepID=UPI001379382B|nr:hypothetical protein [Acinetobacter sp. A47]